MQSGKYRIRWEQIAGSCVRGYEEVKHARTLPGDFPLVLEIALVADNYHREVILIFDSENLLLERRDLFEALPGCDGVDQ